jgi:methylsterol monooxygenase
LLLLALFLPFPLQPPSIIFFPQLRILLFFFGPVGKHNVCSSLHPFVLLLSPEGFLPKDLQLTLFLFPPSRNSTVLPSATYWGQYEEITKFNTDLNIAERLWAAWYAWMQNDVLATGIMSFMMHELVYFGRSLPWIFIDTLGWFKSYKIQNVS